MWGEGWSLDPRAHACFPAVQGARQPKKRKYDFTDRMTVEEIYEIIDGQAHLTFDYLATIVVRGYTTRVHTLTHYHTHAHTHAHTCTHTRIAT